MLCVAFRMHILNVAVNRSPPPIPFPAPADDGKLFGTNLVPCFLVDLKYTLVLCSLLCCCWFFFWYKHFVKEENGMLTFFFCFVIPLLFNC